MSARNVPALEPGPGVPPGLVLLVLLVFGNLLRDQPLERLRPAHEPGGAQEVEVARRPAHLWQDPLSVAYRAPLEAGEPGASASARGGPLSTADASRPPAPGALTTLAEDLRSVPDASEAVLVLPVHLRGGSGAEDAEERRRARFAVVAGLADGGYYARDEGRLSVCVFPSRVAASFGSQRFGAGTEDEVEREALQALAAAIDAPPRTLRVPYEWFTHSGSAADADSAEESGGAEEGEAPPEPASEVGAARSEPPPQQQVLVLWIDEDAFGRHVFAAEMELCDQLFAGLGAWPRVEIVGPTTTGRLLDLLGDARALDAGVGALREHRDAASVGCAGHGEGLCRLPCAGRLRAGAFLADVRVQCPWSTAQLSRHWSDLLAGADPPPTDAGCGPFPETGLRVHRTLGQDRMLIEAIAQELKVRVPLWLGARLLRDPGEEPCIRGVGALEGAALWRATRLLPESFVGLGEPDVDRAGEGASAAPSTGQDPEPIVALVAEGDSDYGRAFALSLREELGDDADIRVFTLLRGTDGVRLGSLAADEGSDPGDEEPGGSEYPAGRHQFDYLRALQSRLRAERHRVVAIGIVATDVYDKLVTLRALRRDFADTLFFTTDLDARMLHPRHLANTRNLLVASHFPLEAQGSPEAPTQPPVLRESYQNSMFRTVGAALRGRVAVAPSEPVLVEVGLKGAVPLPQPGARHEPDRAAAGATRLTERGPLLVALLALCGFAAYVGVGLPLVAMAERCRAVLGPRAYSRWIVSTHVVGVLVSLAVAGIVVLLLRRAELLPLEAYPEPLRWTDGVSAWPAILLRAIALLYGVVAFGLMAADQRLTTRLVDFDVFGGPPADRRGSPQRVRGASGARARVPWRAALGDLRELLLPLASLPRGDSLDALWRAGRGGWWMPSARAVRSVLFAAIAFAAFSPLFELFGSPAVPTRGEYAYLLERVVTFGAIVVQLLLVFHVLNLTWDASRMLAALRNATRLEDEPAYARRHGVDRADALCHARLRVARLLTESVESFALYPAAVMVLLVVSRASFFDRWGWPVPLVLVYAFQLALLVGCAWRIRSEASSLREATLERYRTEHLGLAGEGPRASRLELLISAAQSLRAGAFSPLRQHPLLRAVLLPFAALGGTQLLYVGLQAARLGGA